MAPFYALDRRGFLRVGTTGVLGCCLPTAGVRAGTGGAALPGTGQAKSVLLVMLSGGPSQLDM